MLCVSGELSCEWGMVGGRGGSPAEHVTSRPHQADRQLPPDAPTPPPASLPRPPTCQVYQGKEVVAAIHVQALEPAVCVGGGSKVSQVQAAWVAREQESRERRP